MHLAPGVTGTVAREKINNVVVQKPKNIGRYEVKLDTNGR